MMEYIQHSGVIESIVKNRILVRIEQQTACSSCHAKQLCLASGGKDRIIEVDDFTGRYATDEKVIVAVRSSSGMLAVLTAFVAPLALVIAAAVAGTDISGDEAVGGLVGLSVLIPYYSVIYLLRNRIGKKFVFTLSKAEDGDNQLITVTNKI
jgi:sigma-E factor negative regulatory protein RseC